MASEAFKSFVTGSRVYGKPGKWSDIDLVCCVSAKTLSCLLDEAGNFEQQGSDAGEGSGSVSFTFGRLNLICCDERQYEIWQRGTRELKAMRPVTREQAIEHFKALRKDEGR